MDEEEIEGLLPRTDLDNASQQSVSTEDVMLGGAGLGSIGFYNQTGRMPSPVINKSSPVTPSFQPPAVQGPSTVTTTQPTTLTTTRPTTLTTNPTPDPYRTLPRYTGPRYTGPATLGGARLLGAAGVKGAAAFGAGYGVGTGINELSQFAPGMDDEKISDKLAKVIAPDVFQNAEALERSSQLQADFRNETARLKAIEAAEAARQKEISDLIGAIPGEMALEELRRDGPKNLQEAYDASGVMGTGIAPSYNQASDEQIRAQREARAAADKQRMFDKGNQFEAAYQLPDGTFEGRLRGGGKRIMTPEELELMDYSQTRGNPAVGQPPLGEYQAVPGTDGFVRLPIAPTPAPVTSPLIGTSPQVAPAPIARPAVASAPTGLIGTRPETNFTPEELSLINNNPFLPPEMRPASDVTSDTGGAPIVAESPSVNRTNQRPITAADANNPAFEGMSAAEIIEAVNAPGYVSPDSVDLGFTPTPSRASELYSGYTDAVGTLADIGVATGKTLVSPLLVGYDYLFNTPDNAQPSLKDSLQRVGEDIAEVRDFPIRSKFRGETAAPMPEEIFKAQDARNVEFLNREAAETPPAMVAEQPNFGQIAQEVASIPEAAPQSLPPATINNFRDRGMTLSQFMRYEDEPSRRTEQFVDAQGRIRRRLTPDAARLQGFTEKQIAQGTQLAPEYLSYEADAADREARVRAADAQRAQNRISGGAASGGVASKQGGYSDADLRAIFGGGEALKRAKALARTGTDPVTMKPFGAAENDSEMDALRKRILQAQADAAEKGDDPNDAKIKELRAAMLDEQLKQLRKKGLPQEFTFRPGPNNTVIVSRNGNDISYFKQGEDIPAALAELGYDVGDAMNATPAGAGSEDTVMMTDRDGNPRIVPKGDVQEALQNGYKIK